MNRELILVGVGLLLMTIHPVDESIVFGAPGPLVDGPGIVVAGVAGE